MNTSRPLTANYANLNVRALSFITTGNTEGKLADLAQKDPWFD